MNPQPHKFLLMRYVLYHCVTDVASRVLKLLSDSRHISLSRGYGNNFICLNQWMPFPGINRSLRKNNKITSRPLEMPSPTTWATTSPPGQPMWPWNTSSFVNRKTFFWSGKDSITKFCLFRTRSCSKS